jgi:hypothetical protein
MFLQASAPNNRIGIDKAQNATFSFCSLAGKLFFWNLFRGNHFCPLALYILIPPQKLADIIFEKLIVSYARCCFVL